MSRLIMFNLMTLDGFFEGPRKWDLDWHQLVVDGEFHHFALGQLRSADRLLFGRVTYEGMAAHWTKAQGEIAELMNSLPKFVFTRSRMQLPWINTTVIADNAPDAVVELKRSGIQNSFVLGSANLSRTLMEYDLFDEYRVFVTPVILGNGTPLFPSGNVRRVLKLLEARPMSSGGVLLRYEPVRNK